MRKYTVVHMGVIYRFNADGYTLNNNHHECYVFYVSNYNEDNLRRDVFVVPKKHTIISMIDNLTTEVINTNVMVSC